MNTDETQISQRSPRRTSWLERAGDFLSRLWLKVIRDDILFLASGLAFNGLACLLPTLLLMIYLLGLWFQSGETAQHLNRILETAFPNQPHAETIRDAISSLLSEIVARRRSFGVISLLLLMGTSASLVSCTRSVLHQVFEVTAKRHFVFSYLADLLLVFVCTMLIVLTITLGWALRIAGRLRELIPAIAGLEFLRHWASFQNVVSPMVIFLLCYVLYRFVPVEQPVRKTALISAATTTIIWEISARLFAWFLSTISSVGSLYGAYAFLIVLMVWAFYSSVIFVLGAEVGKVWQDRRVESTPG